MEKGKDKMPKFEKMLDGFMKQSHHYENYNGEDVEGFLGKGPETLRGQEEIEPILTRNIIATTRKEILNVQIQEGIENYIKGKKGFKDKVDFRKIANNLVDYLNGYYGFEIDLTNLNSLPFGSREERCVYLLRNTERRLQGEADEDNGLRTIAEELGCTPRALQKDLKHMTEQGFKLLGVNIELVDNREKLLNMDSTPHPIILMENISQLVVMLEGLRQMSSIKGYKEYAKLTALSIWGQLTDYARSKVKKAVVLFSEEKDIAQIKDWYRRLESEEKYRTRFISEIEMSDKSIETKLMYLGKSEERFDISYKADSGEILELNGCSVYRFHVRGEKVQLHTMQGECELNVSQIQSIECL